MSSEAPLFVIGAGPKAAAIAAKSKMLRECNIDTPRVYVLENKEVAANWLGNHGFTNGLQRLGTPPEKDIGFPYRPDSQDIAVTRKLFARFSWSSYQIFAKKKFGDWIDRGKLHPTHEEWGQYVSWVLKHSADEIVDGDLKKIDPADKHWTLELNDKKGTKRTFESSGIVFTGPGVRKVPNGLKLKGIRLEDHRRILFGDNFWNRLDVLHRISREKEAPPIVVVGGGETAASIVNTLLDNFENTAVSILVLTRSGTLFSRGEGYYENRMFTDQSAWRGLPKEVRQEIIDRSDRGVISVAASKRIAYAHNVDHRFMGVEKLARGDGGDETLLINDSIRCQLLIFALGFDPFWFRDLFPPEIKSAFSTLRSCLDIQEKIGYDLSINHPTIKGKLYLPMVSALAQGPGFPNLSCLGDLSDRILCRHKEPEITI